MPIYTTLKLVLFYITIANGCRCKQSASTNKDVDAKPTGTAQEQVTQQTASTNLSSVQNPLIGTLDTNQNEGKKEKEKEDDEEKKKKIEELLETEKKRLELEEKENFIDELFYRAEPIPTAPNYEDAPPSYNPDWSNNLHPKTNINKGCQICIAGNHRTFDEKDIENLRKNRSAKSKFLRYCSRANAINALKNTIEVYWKKRHLYVFKDKLVKLEKIRTELDGKKNKIAANGFLCGKHKEKELKHIFIQIDTIDYKIERWNKIIEIIEHNDQSNQATNKKINLYPNLSLYTEDQIKNNSSYNGPTPCPNPDPPPPYSYPYPYPMYPNLNAPNLENQ